MGDLLPTFLLTDDRVLNSVGKNKAPFEPTQFHRTGIFGLLRLRQLLQLQLCVRNES